ncbi:MAG TPA: hypothetical protein VLB84_02790 [Bacteroidia bacterium]|jgi:hypothetical protein|nr:hypothetical protein [Bacteroidia bacterium]
MTLKISYPQYRKYKNNKVYFKIISAVEWEELHLTKNSLTLHTFHAKILPDRNYIDDMTFHYHEHWDIIHSDEYESLKKNVDL